MTKYLKLGFLSILSFAGLYIAFKGEDLEQETMFLEDPNGNCMEIKTMKNPNTLFKK